MSIREQATHHAEGGCPCRLWLYCCCRYISIIPATDGRYAPGNPPAKSSPPKGANRLLRQPPANSPVPTTCKGRRSRLARPEKSGVEHAQREARERGGGASGSWGRNSSKHDERGARKKMAVLLLCCPFINKAPRKQTQPYDTARALCVSGVETKENNGYIFRR